MFEVGKSYKTYGGWEAKIIWKSGDVLIAIHNPYTKDEVLVKHTKDGIYTSDFILSQVVIFTYENDFSKASLTSVEVL